MTKPVFYSPTAEGAVPLAQFLSTLDMSTLATLRDKAKAVVDPDSAKPATFKSVKAAVNALTVLIERQEKAGFITGINIDATRGTAWIAFSRNRELPPALNVELTRDPATLAAQAASAKQNVVRDKERVVVNPRTPAKPEGAAAVSKARVDEKLVIVAKFDKVPRREGSKAAQRLALLQPGMTVEQFVTAVAAVPGDKAGRVDKKLARRARRLIKKSIAAGHVELSDPTSHALKAAQAAKEVPAE